MTVQTPTTPVTAGTNNTTPAAPAAPTTPTPDGKTTPPDAGKAPEGANPPSTPPAPSSLLDGNASPAAPEKYDLKMPEGVSPDTKILEGFEPLAREMGLSNENAQKLVDLYAKHVDGLQQAQTAALDAQRKEWVAEIQKDPKYGETLSMAKRGLSAVATPEAAKLIVGTWLGDHPAIIQTFAKVGRMLSEHTIHTGTETTKPDKASPEKVLYPNLNKA